MAKRRRVVAPEEKTASNSRFFRRPKEEIPSVVVAAAPVQRALGLPDDGYFESLLSDTERANAQIVHSDIVFEVLDKQGAGIQFLSEIADGKKILRIEITIENYRLFKTLDIKQAISLTNKLEWYLREEES